MNLTLLFSLAFNAVLFVALVVLFRKWAPKKITMKHATLRKAFWVVKLKGHNRFAIYTPTGLHVHGIEAGSVEISKDKEHLNKARLNLFVNWAPSVEAMHEKIEQLENA